MLFLHGLPTSGRLWDYVVPQLAPFFTCVVVDLPGSGTSAPLADWSLDPERYVDEIEALCRQLDPRPRYIVGHDAGAAFAVHYSARCRDEVDRLVLCSPPVFPEHRVPWFFRLVRVPVLGDALAPVLVTLLWRPGFRLSIRRRDRCPDDLIAAFQQPFRGYRGWRWFTRMLRWGDPTVVLGKTAALLPRIGARTLILHGRRDGAIPVSFAMRAAQQIPSAEVQILDGGHFLPLSCSEEVSERLLGFLSQPPELAPDVNESFARGGG